MKARFQVPMTLFKLLTCDHLFCPYSPHDFISTNGSLHWRTDFPFFLTVCNRAARECRNAQNADLQDHAPNQHKAFHRASKVIWGSRSEDNAGKDFLATSRLFMPLPYRRRFPCSGGAGLMHRRMSKCLPASAELTIAQTKDHSHLALVFPVLPSSPHWGGVLQTLSAKLTSYYLCSVFTSQALLLLLPRVLTLKTPLPVLCHNQQNIARIWRHGRFKLRRARPRL